MNFRSCKYFLEICESGSMNSAAKKLYVSQQSLSEQIQRMESELGVPLIIRSTPIVLTPAGECFKETAVRIVSLLDSLDQSLRQFRTTADPTIVIGLVDYGIPEFLPEIIEAFLKKYPSTDIETREIKSNGIPDDLSFIIGTKKIGGLYTNRIIMTDPSVLCVQDKLLKQIYGSDRESITAELSNGHIAVLKDCPFVKHKGTALEELAEKIYKNNQFKPLFINFKGSFDAFLRLCKSGQAAMILPQKFADHELPGVPYYPIANTEGLNTILYLSYRKDIVLPENCRQFINTLLRLMKDR